MVWKGLLAMEIDFEPLPPWLREIAEETGGLPEREEDSDDGR